MNQGQARRWIDRHYGNQKRHEKSQASPPAEAELIEVLEQVPNLRPENDAQQTALELFLFNGCLRFGRWFAPAPPSVPRAYRELFGRFAQALSQTERQVMNASVFLIHT